MNRPLLTPDERPEWEALVRSVLGGDMTATDITAKTHRLLDALADAEQAQRQWVGRVREQAEFHGLRDMLKTFVRDNSTTSYRGHDGSVAAISTRVGIERDGCHQQVLFTELTRDELARHVDMLVRQRKGINDRLTVERRLLRLMADHPTAKTVGEALAMAGTTLDALLDAA